MTTRLQSRRAPGYVLALLLAGCGAGSAADVSGRPIPDDDQVGVAEEQLSLRSGNLWTPIWTGLTQIPVCFKNGTSANRSNVQQIAEGSWEAIGASTVGPNGRYGVDFTGWGTCPSNTAGMIPIKFDNDAPEVHTDGLGIGIQLMTLWTFSSKDSIIHEFGHALGYTHEFRRSDYAAVDPDCTETAGTAPDLALTSVDVQSIMNYKSCGRAGNITLLDAVAHSALYGPQNILYGQNLALRHEPTWNYVRGDSVPDTLMSGILEDRELRLVKVSDPAGTGQVNFGDSVRIRTSDGQFLKSNGKNHLVTKWATTSIATTWKILGRSTSGPVRVNDQVLFQASDLAYLRSDSSNLLMTADTGDFFRLANLMSALNL